MNTILGTVKAGTPKYTIRLICDKTGVDATLHFPIDYKNKTQLIERVTQALGTLESIQFEDDKEDEIG